jgi:hypothetical protein
LAAVNLRRIAKGQPGHRSLTIAAEVTVAASCATVVYVKQEQTMSGDYFLIIPIAAMAFFIGVMGFVSIEEGVIARRASRSQAGSAR